MNRSRAKAIHYQPRWEWQRVACGQALHGRGSATAWDKVTCKTCIKARPGVDDYEGAVRRARAAEVRA